MKIQGVGVDLLRLRKEHIELLRYWRNHPDIVVFMDYRTFITEEMQLKWFENLDATKDFYFIISFEKKDIGLIHLSDISWQNKSGHAGLFIWDQKYWNTQVPVFASMHLISFAFEFLGLEKLIAKVMHSNSTAIRYNTSLGFKAVNKFENYSIYELEEADASYEKLKKRLSKLSKKKPLSYQVNTQDYNVLQALPNVKNKMAELIKLEKLSLRS